MIDWVDLREMDRPHPRSDRPRPVLSNASMVADAVSTASRVPKAGPEDRGYHALGDATYPLTADPRRRRMTA